MEEARATGEGREEEEPRRRRRCDENNEDEGGIDGADVDGLAAERPLAEQAQAHALCLLDREAAAADMT